MAIKGGLLELGDQVHINKVLTREREREIRSRGMTLSKKVVSLVLIVTMVVIMMTNSASCEETENHFQRFPLSKKLRLSKTMFFPEVGGRLKCEGAQCIPLLLSGCECHAFGAFSGVCTAA